MSATADTVRTMANDVLISDVPGFPAKVETIRTAAEAIRTEVAKMKVDALASFDKEAQSFTRDGSVSPVYADARTKLSEFWDKQVAAAGALADSGINVASTCAAKYTKITGVDASSAADVQKT